MKDKLIKYVDLGRSFRDQASQVEISVKQNQKTIERIAKYLSTARPADRTEIERNDTLRDFCIKVAVTNESTLNALQSWRGTFQEILSDLELVEASMKANTLEFQSETIEFLNLQREELIQTTANEVRQRIKGNS
jgi:hypothetical protein